MGLMALTDATFMLPERRESPIHVGGLQVFELPEGAGPDYVTDLYERALSATDIAPVFAKRATRGPLTLGAWAWTEDREIDLEHHVRHSALPRPGRVRELLALVSRLHGTLLDRERPLWEVHLIEGLEGNRFAVYSKLHHSLMDGVSATRLMERTLSTSPDGPTGMLWQRQPEAPREDRPSALRSAPKTLWGLGTDAVTLGPRLARLAASSMGEVSSPLPMQAPRSRFNASITGSRRFAAQSWSLPRVKAVGKAAGCTLNDVVLAMCSSALRDYLLDLHDLPDEPLVAMTPVSLRAAGDTTGGNSVSAILANLATDLEDPAERLAAIHTSMEQGKAGLRDLSPLQRVAVAGVVMSPLLLNSLVGMHKVARPPFNLIISNVPGPRDPLYWNGARLQGHYPLSIPLEGQALNITLVSYDGQLHVGITGCRRTVPHLQRMLFGLEKGLADLEQAYGITSPATV